MKKNKIVEILSFPISLVFIYTGFSKYFNLDLFIHSMRSQPFPGWLAVLLIYILPAFEIVNAFLLLNTGTRRIGLYSAGLLVLAFTMYSWSAYLHLFSKQTPCPCGGMISSFSWKQHIYFNTFLLILLLYSLIPDINNQKKIVNWV